MKSISCDVPLAPALLLLQLTPDSKQRADTLPPDLEAVTGAQNLTHANSAGAADAEVCVDLFMIITCPIIGQKLSYRYMP